MKRVISIMAVVLTILSTLSVTTFASNTSFTRTVRYADDPHRFDFEWEHTRILIVEDEAVARLVYGYDMDFINEDYAWARAEDYRAKAGIKRDVEDNFSYSNYQDRRTYSKEELRHLNHDDDNVNIYYYRIIIEHDYSLDGELSYVTLVDTHERQY